MQDTIEVFSAHPEGNFKAIDALQKELTARGGRFVEAAEFLSTFPLRFAEEASDEKGVLWYNWQIDFLNRHGFYISGMMEDAAGNFRLFIKELTGVERDEKVSELLKAAESGIVSLSNHESVERMLASTTAVRMQRTSYVLLGPEEVPEALLGALKEMTNNKSYSDMNRLLGEIAAGRLDDNHCRILVAYYGDEPVGWASLWNYVVRGHGALRGKERAVTLHSVFVKKHLRRYGIGSALVTLLRGYASVIAHGETLVWAGPNDFWEKLGFNE